MTRRLSLLVLALVVLVSRPSAQAPAAPPPPGVVRNGNFSPIIGDLDRSLAFYEGLLKMQVPPARDGQRPFFNNPGLHRMFGTTGANERHTDARIPGTSMGIEMIEFHDIERRAVRPRFQDAGAVTLVLLVREVDTMLARLRRCRGQDPDAGGQEVASNGGRSVLLEDADGRPVELRQLSVPPPTNAPAGSGDRGRAAHDYGERFGEDRRRVPGCPRLPGWGADGVCRRLRPRSSRSARPRSPGTVCRSAARRGPGPRGSGRTPSRWCARAGSPGGRGRRPSTGPRRGTSRTFRISGVHHDSCRGSTATRVADGKQDRQASSSRGSARRVGGSWSSTGPSRAPSPSAWLISRCTGSSGSFSRLMWVRYRLALTATTKSPGTRSRHASKVSRVGSR